MIGAMMSLLRNVNVVNEVEIANDDNNPIAVEGLVEVTNDNNNPIPVIVQNGGTDPIAVEVTNSITAISTPVFGTTDSFGRQRISQPLTIFDSQNRYKQDSKWSTVTASSGNATYVAAESAVNLNVTGSTGSKVVQESVRVIPYQPGKSLLLLMTFAMNTPKTNLRQRVGFFGINNGIYLENDGEYNYLVLRSQSLNVTRRIRQDSWNNDVLADLVINKTQILWIDIEWLGVGNVRCGFIVDGQYVLAHTFRHSNIELTTYMTTACLPLRYEIENTGTTGSSSTLKKICSTAISEGGYNQKTKQWSATRTTAIASTAVADGWAPVISLKLATGREDAVVIPGQIHLSGTGNGAYYEFSLIRNATITGGSWVNHSSSGGNVDYNANATSMSGGVVEESGFFTSTTQARGAVSTNLDYIFDLQIGRDQTPTSDTVTLAVRHLAVGGDVYGSLNWNDLV
jgi:hypothetical protein